MVQNIDGSYYVVSFKFQCVGDQVAANHAFDPPPGSRLQREGMNVAPRNLAKWLQQLAKAPGAATGVKDGKRTPQSLGFKLDPLDNQIM